MIVNTKDLLAGLLFVGLGLFFGIYAYSDLEFGTAFRMGPGFFPMVLACLLIVIGLVVALQSINKEQSPMTAMAFRGMLFILVAPVVFGLVLRGFNIRLPGMSEPIYQLKALGFVPAVVLVCAISAFASRRMTLVKGLVITVLMTAFCVVVFIKGLGLPVPLFGVFSN